MSSEIPQLERIRLNVADDADWPNGVPTNPKDGIDDLAARAKDLEDAGGGGGGQSRVWITNLTGSGDITSKVYEADTSPSNLILEEATSNNDDITVHLLIEGGAGDDWHADASVTVSGGGATPVVVAKADWTQAGSGRMWTATANLTDADTTATITATLSTGDTATLDYTRALDPPEILSAGFDGAYPTAPETGLQTAVKTGDTVTLTGTVETHATRIQVVSSGASSSTQNFDDDYSSGTFSIDVTCGSASGSQHFYLKANKDGGAYGSQYESDNTISMDQAAHSYGSFTNKVFSPVSNFALASSDSMTGDLTISNWNASDVITYTSSEVTITSDTTYAVTKTYTYASGSYRDSGTNVTLTSRRKANGKQSSTTYLVKIANTSPILTMLGATSRLRSRASGGDKTYTLTISSAQELKEAPTCSRDSADDGDALGAWSGSAPDKTWTNTIAIGEEDTDGTYSWNDQTVLATNGAGKTVAAIATNVSYSVGGFEERSISMAQFEEYNPIGTAVSGVDNAAKLVCAAYDAADSEKTSDLTYKTNTTQNDGGREFTIVDSGGSFDATGDYVRCTDGEIFNLPYTIRLEEDA